MTVAGETKPRLEFDGIDDNAQAYYRQVGPDGTPWGEWLQRRQIEAAEQLRAVLSQQQDQPQPHRDADKLPALVSKKEVAAVLRCSERSIDRLVRTGMLRASRRSLGGSSRVLIDRASLLRYLGSIRE